jgi:hypothetical protein
MLTHFTYIPSKNTIIVLSSPSGDARSAQQVILRYPLKRRNSATTWIYFFYI